MTLIVGIYLFDEVEVLDFAGRFEVLSMASRVLFCCNAYPQQTEI
jgi:hypothetical protein